MNRLRIAALAVAAVALAGCASARPAPFDSASTAAARFVEAARAEDMAALESYLGPDGHDILHSGDDVADRAARRRFVALYDERHRLEPSSDGSLTLVLGTIEWPFPIPLARDSDAAASWRFDTAAGLEELIRRRVGRNELNVIEVCRAISDAQSEYAEVDRDSDGVLEYAQKIRSSPGRRDGLFWRTEPGEPPSPLGEFCAAAAAEGYAASEAPSEPRPYHGYYYRLLAAQGPTAPGGEREYRVRDDLVGGVALVAYPAEYGVSGVMTFIASLDGGVYECDLGDETPEIAVEMARFEPGDDWRRVEAER